MWEAVWGTQYAEDPASRSGAWTTKTCVLKVSAVAQGTHHASPPPVPIGSHLWCPRFPTLHGLTRTCSSPAHSDSHPGCGVICHSGSISIVINSESLCMWLLNIYESLEKCLLLTFFLSLYAALFYATVSVYKIVKPCETEIHENSER